MDNTALILLLAMVTLIAVMVYLFLYPTVYVPVKPRHHMQPYPVMPQFGPYWSHGGQANSGLLY